MNTQPPRVAAWLLRHLGCSPNNEAVVGDLNEGYQRGRSRMWYWRQALTAVAIAWYYAICSQKLLTICVLAISRLQLLLIVRVFQYLSSGAANPLTAYAFTNILPYSWWGYNSIFWPVDVLLTGGPLFLICVFTSWLITRFSRSHKREMVLTSFIFMCAVVSAPIYRMLLGLVAVPLYFSIRGLTIPLLILIGILYGGGLLTNSRSASLSHKA